MKKITLNLEKLAKDARGYHAEIGQELGVSLVSVWARLSGKVRMQLAHISIIASIVDRDPREYLIFHEDEDDGGRSWLDQNLLYGMQPKSHPQVLAEAATLGSNDSKLL